MKTAYSGLNAADAAGEMRAIETRNDLKIHLSRYGHGVTVVKPRVFFKRVEDQFDGPVDFHQHIPSSGLGSITMLEAAIIASILKVSDPRTVFEFGTFLGYTTALLLRNSHPECAVYSLDIGIDGMVHEAAGEYSYKELHSDDRKNDDYLRFTQAKTGPYYLKKLSEDLKGRLILINEDSREIDIESHGLKGCVDFVFVDGGHTSDVVGVDSKNAFDMVGEDGVIIWHDFNSTIHREVSVMLNELAQERPVLHVQHTMLALCFVGSALDRFLDCNVD